MKKKLCFSLLAALLLAGCGGNEGTDVVAGANATQEAEESAASRTEAEDTIENTLEAAIESTAQNEPETAAESTAEQEDEKETIIMNGINIMEECPSSVYERRDDVAYGAVVHQTYHSDTTGLDRGVNILLPANYDDSKEYPVLYLLHGIFGDEYSFTNDSNIKLVEIMGNLAADGLAKEMIVVLPNMYAATDPEQKPAFNVESVAPYDNFINDLVNDLMPYIAENYSVLSGRENTAIAGFSMGGRETLFIGLSRPDLFAYVGAIAPAPGLTPGKDWAMNHPGQLSEEELTFEGKDFEPAVLMVCCGTKDSVVGKFPESYHNIFEKNQVSHVWYEVPGADHDAQAIKSGLNNYVRAIFKD